MRNPTLYEALRTFAEEASAALQSETASGAEIPFELVEAGARPRGGVPLYCYRPLTGRFIDQQSARIRSLSAYGRALSALEQEPGLEAYLRDRGRRSGSCRPHDRAVAGLGVFLERLFEGRSEFSLAPSRIDCAYQELERSLYEGPSQTVVLAPLLGLELDPETVELPLGDGLSLIRGEEMGDAPPEAVWGEGERANVLIVLTLQDDRGPTAPITAARARFRRLLSALRLYEKGEFALGPLAWTRRDDGVWRAAALGSCGGAAPARSLAAEQEDELRAFANLIARRTPSAGEVLWALARYEMGRERSRPAEALTDYLLALRALLEPEGPSSGRLAQRLSTICAVPAQRAALAGRVVKAVELERSLIAGYGSPDPRNLALITEVAEYLRAILRDVLCGHLDEDLVAVADELLAGPVGAGEEFEPGRSREPAARPGKFENPVALG